MRSSAYGACLSGSRVLVVEDEALLAMMLEDDLIAAGAEVIGPAASCRAALDLLDGAERRGGLHAAVLDVNLAGEVVLPVADALAVRGIPFVFATGYTAGFDAGQHATAPVLSKPYTAAELIDATANLLNAKSGADWRFGRWRQWATELPSPPAAP